MKTWPRRKLPFDEERDASSRRCDSDRREEDLAAAVFGGEQRLREFARPVHRADERQQPRLHVLAPFGAEILERDAELAPERALDADARHRVHDLPDDLVAPLLADERPQRMAVAIREVLVRIVGQLARSSGCLPFSAASRIHAVVIVRVRAERQILRHSLGEPERRHELRERLKAVAGFAAREDVVLERVHHLVREHVLEARDSRR